MSDGGVEAACRLLPRHHSFSLLNQFTGYSIVFAASPTPPQ